MELLCQVFCSFEFHLIVDNFENEYWQQSLLAAYKQFNTETDCSGSNAVFISFVL